MRSWLELLATPSYCWACPQIAASHAPVALLRLTTLWAQAGRGEGHWWSSPGPLALATRFQTPHLLLGSWPSLEGQPGCKEGGKQVPSEGTSGKPCQG